MVPLDLPPEQKSRNCTYENEPEIEDLSKTGIEYKGFCELVFIKTWWDELRKYL